jgi:hypothetical protein
MPEGTKRRNPGLAIDDRYLEAHKFGRSATPNTVPDVGLDLMCSSL